MKYPLREIYRKIGPGKFIITNYLGWEGEAYELASFGWMDCRYIGFRRGLRTVKK